MKYTDALERQSVLLLAVLVLLAVTLRKLLKIGSREPDLPPGPPTIPVFGNMLQVPSTQTEWQYVYINILTRLQSISDKINHNSGLQSGINNTDLSIR